MKKPKIDIPNDQFIQALALVLSASFRRISTTYTDTKNGKFEATIYRVSDKIVRAEFNKPEPKLSEEKNNG